MIIIVGIKKKLEAVPTWGWVVLAIAVFAVLGRPGFLYTLPRDQGILLVDSPDKSFSFSCTETGWSYGGASSSDTGTIIIPEGSYIELVSVDATCGSRSGYPDYDGCSSCSATASVLPYFKLTQSSSNFEGAGTESDFKIIMEKVWIDEELSFKPSVSCSAGTNSYDQVSASMTVHILLSSTPCPEGHHIEEGDCVKDVEPPLCGQGTFEYLGGCVVACPEGTELEGNECVPTAPVTGLAIVGGFGLVMLIIVVVIAAIIIRRSR